MRLVIKQVVSISAIFALIGLYNSNINNIVLTDTNLLLFIFITFIGISIALAFNDKTQNKCFEQKVKNSFSKAVLPTFLLVILSNPNTYKYVNKHITNFIQTPLLKELTNSPTTEGVALHTGIFALVYYLALTKLQL